MSLNTAAGCLGCVVVDCQRGVLRVQILRLCRAAFVFFVLRTDRPEKQEVAFPVH